MYEILLGCLSGSSCTSECKVVYIQKGCSIYIATEVGVFVVMLDSIILVLEINCPNGEILSLWDALHNFVILVPETVSCLGR